MTTVTLRGLRERKLRGALTALAVLLGVAMVAGTLMLNDSINREFEQIFETANEGIDVSVQRTVEVSDPENPQIPTFQADVVEQVRAVDGVELAAGQLTGPATILDEDGERVGPMGPPQFAISVVDDRVSAFSFERGREPQGPDEVALDASTAEAGGFAIGDRVRVSGAEPAKRYELVGITEFGEGDSLGGAAFATLTLAEAQRLLGEAGRVAEILAVAGDGVSDAQLKTRVAGALDTERFEVRTGEEAAQAASDDFQEGFGFFTTALLVFAGIALFVAAFLIFNTFSITVAQRTSEFAMLRTLGASRRQVLRSVLLEAALLGLVAGALGVAGGAGFVALITGLFSAFGFDLPTAGLRLTPSIVLISLGVALGATVLSALVPALRATRVAPLEAMRASSLSREAGFSVRRTAIAAVIAGVGVALVALGLFGGLEADGALSSLGAGCALVFLGVAALSDRLIGPLAALLGAPIAAVTRFVGGLARENAQRNPQRTAVTAGALTIGLTLVTVVAVFASSILESVDRTIDEQFAGDLTLISSDGFSPFSSNLADRVEGVDGVRTAVGLSNAVAEVDGIAGRQRINGIPGPQLTDVVRVDWTEGSDALLGRLARDEAIVEQGWAEDNGIEVGERLRVTAPDGEQHSFTVRGAVDDEIGLVTETLAIPRAQLREDFGARQDFFAIVDFAAADGSAARQRVERLLEREFPAVQANDQAELKEQQRDQLAPLLTMIGALLALSVIVSLFGVVNTLVLTVYERTRELGMLRAIGTSRRQVRRMIRYEAVITCLIGAVIGLVLGLLLSLALIQALEDEGISLAIPTAPLIGFLVLAALAGVVAAILPARRASRIDVLEALAYE